MGLDLDLGLPWVCGELGLSDRMFYLMFPTILKSGVDLMDVFGGDGWVR